MEDIYKRIPTLLIIHYQSFISYTGVTQLASPAGLRGPSRLLYGLPDKVSWCIGLIMKVL